MTPRRRKTRQTNNQAQATSEADEIDTPQTAPAEMKVTELRAALTDLGLSPKGVKRELVERLEGSLKERGNGSKKPSSLFQETSLENDKETSLENDKEASLENDKEASLENDKEASLENDKEASLENDKKETASETKEKVSTLDIKAQSPVTTMVDTETQEQTQEQEPITLINESLETTTREHLEVSGNRLQELDSINVPPLPAPESNEEETQHPTHPMEDCLNPMHQPPAMAAPIVHIRNLVRPFTIPAVKDLVGQFGQVLDFWMDALKTQCFVHYHTPMSAKECINRLNGFKWPVDSGKTLNVALSTLDEMERAKLIDRPDKPKQAILDEEESPLVLDKLFMRTKTIPPLYYLPANQID